MGRIRTLSPLLRTIDTRTVRPAEKRAADFYLSSEWRKLMTSIIAERGRKCEAPGCGRRNTRIFGDHIVELKDGGPPLDRRNVRLLCGSCHTKKTLATRATRMAERF